MRKPMIEIFRLAAAGVLVLGAWQAARAEENLNAPPISGELYPLDANTKVARLRTENASVSLDTSAGSPAVKVDFSKANYPNVQFPCPNGGWNLSPFEGVQVELTNVGQTKVRAALRVDNPGDWKDEPWNTQMTSLAPGESQTLKLVFGQNNGAPGFPLDSRRIVGIQVFLIKPKQDGNLLLIRDLKAFGTAEGSVAENALSTPADRNKPVTPPPWLGQRPPVEGDWVQTLDENFDGPGLNEKLWTPRLVWDGPAKGEIQRYAEENVTVENGMLLIKCEKKKGHQYNNPSLESREYTTGACTSYDKWTQLYGYIEARLRPPTARGLWPAFWTMPDRGAASELDVWKRRHTGGKGMEIDIFEHLTEWGPGRYNIAAHWDGYGPKHKQWGSANTYYGPTPDGWHVAGLLWEPGKLTWYMDGIKKGEWTSDRVCAVPAYLKFTVQMGNWATKNVDDASLPQNFEIDYVRAWQLKSRMAAN